MAKVLKLPVVKNPFRVEDGAAFLKLNCMGTTVETQIDLKDLARVGRYRWYGYMEKNGTIYVHARPARRAGGRHCLKLHRVVCRLKTGDNRHAHHRFQNTLDNRRSKLDILTPKQHHEIHARIRQDQILRAA